MNRPLTLATPTMLQLRAAFTVAAAWLLGTPARLIAPILPQPILFEGADA